MYIPFAFSYKNTLRVKRRWVGLFFSLHTLCIEKSHPYLKICVRRTTAVRKVQYSDLFFRLHGVRHTLNYTQYTLSISYLDTQNWNVLLIFTVKRFVSVTKNMYPLKRKGKLLIDLFPYFYLPFRRYWYKRREEIKTLFRGFPSCIGPIF